MSAFFGYEVEPCWNCGSPRFGTFRYCPNCGLWLMDATPLRYSRGTNVHGGESFVMAMDDGQRQHRVPIFAACPPPESSQE